LRPKKTLLPLGPCMASLKWDAITQRPLGDVWKETAISLKGNPGNIKKTFRGLGAGLLGWKLAPAEKSSHPHQNVRVLVYHKLSKNKAHRMTVRESVFGAQMRFLRENGYRVIPLEVLFNFLDFKGRIPSKSAVIMINEEWRSAYEVVFPILKKCGYPAIFLLTRTT